ncbi:MAG: zf-HC2 domain-containing protein [Rhodanobacteraceae bacterium]|nr:MAG: zf-HC2 domain-containing protein [Rhodanobacteraceae bacterium]
MTIETNFGKDCARAWEIMPWVLQASAPAEQREWLMHHIAQCESCSTEFTQQSQLRSALKLPADVHVDVETGFKHLVERLDAPEPGTLPARLHSGSRLTKALAVAVLVQAIGIGVLGARLWSDEVPQYRALGQPALIEPAGAIRVAPAASMTLADWDKLLHGFDLRVVDGPNEAGAYTVVAKRPPTPSTRLLQELRASRNIRLAEPVDDTP